MHRSRPARRPDPPCAGRRAATRQGARRRRRARHSGRRRRAGGRAPMSGRHPEGPRLAPRPPRARSRAVRHAARRRHQTRARCRSQTGAGQLRRRGLPGDPRPRDLVPAGPREHRDAGARCARRTHPCRTAAETPGPGARGSPLRRRAPNGQLEQYGLVHLAVAEALYASRNTERELRAASGPGHRHASDGDTPDLGRQRAAVDRLEPQSAPPRAGEREADREQREPSRWKRRPEGPETYRD